jgi:ABC-type branched-subunit amino acid transport system substrate-binding protein
MLVAAALTIGIGPVFAQKKYDAGADDKQIKIGMTAPLSGPASAYGQIAKAAEAYIRKVNEEGGVNGRKIVLMVADDGYSPPKTIEQTRRLVENEEVLAMFAGVGGAPNGAVQKYLNTKKVPQMFIGSGATKWDNPKEFPWTIAWQPNYLTEAAAYMAFIDKTKPGAKIGILYQDDEFGKDYINSLEKVMGPRFKQQVISQQSYTTSDPTVDTQMISLKASGADVVYLFATPKFAAQAIRKMGDLSWKPLTVLSNASASIGATLTPAGLDRSVGVISTRYLKDTTEPGIETDAGYKEWLAFMNKYLPDGNKQDFLNVYGYSVAQTLVHVIAKSGDNLTHDNLMKQATSIKGLSLPMLINGVVINNDPARYTPVRQLQLIRFDGTRWVPFGELVGD